MGRVTIIVGHGASYPEVTLSEILCPALTARDEAQTADLADGR
jgi:hypothetical protein